MKQERKITLTLEKAREWYKKGEELREVALQVFSKEELVPPVEYVVLGLPSGTLWAITNEKGYYSHPVAVSTFGDSLPKLTDFAELYDYCKREWCEEKEGMVVTGPNGNKICFPASGYRKFNALNEVGRCGYYWSASTVGQDAYFLLFGRYGFVNPLSSGYRAPGLSIRLIKRKSR